MECIVCGGRTISLAGNETIGSIDDGDRIEFGLFDPKGQRILKEDANAILTYVNRSQKILIVKNNYRHFYIQFHNDKFNVW